MASPSTAAALAAPASEPPALSDPPASSRAEVPQAEGKAEKVADDESEAESGTNRTPYSQKMEEALSCVICHCIFYNCVSLSPCMHSFCKGCVAQSLARSRNGSCPICRCTVTAAPPNCVIREVVSVFTDNHPERKRKAEEMANLDEHSKSLDRFFERRGRKRGDGEEAAGGDGGEDVGSDDVGPEDEEGEELGAMLLMGSFEGSVSQVDEALFEGADVNTRDRSERTPVHFAAMKGNLECLRKLLAAGGDVEPLDQQGQTPLCMAAEGGHDSCVRLLMEAGVNINEMTPYGDFPLHIAVQMGHNTVVETLLAANANVGTYDADGYDALALACQGGHTACVKALLRVGADVNGPGEDNMCPLLHAVDDGHEACVNELLAAPGVLVDRRRVSDGCTPLYSAAAKGHLNIVAALLAAGCDYKLTIDETKVTPLMIASHHNRVAIVEKLLEVGSDPNVGSHDGSTAAFYAANNGRADCIKALLAGGANPNQPKNTGPTPLCIAAYMGHADAVVALLQGGADPAMDLKPSAFPLWFANQGQRVEVARILLAAGAPPDQVGPNDVSTLFEAAEMGNDEIAKMLLDKGALVDRRAPEGGETALSMACHMGRGTVVKTLLDFHADVNHRMVSDQFDTPLMLAVMSKSGTARIEVVRTLLERGASVNLRRRDGRTAMDLARGTQGDAKVELLEMLVAAGGMGQFELPAGSLPPTSGE